MPHPKPVFCHGTQADDAELRDLYRSRLDQILDQRHELFRLASLIDWDSFDLDLLRLCGERFVSYSASLSN